jgi:hypothetical protein
MSREAVMIFLFGLEALLPRVSRAQSSAILFSHNYEAAIGPYSHRTSF